MNNRQRGSEKLLAGCTDLQTLSHEELEQVAGAGLLSSPMGVWRVFPRGIPWPDMLAPNQATAAVKQVDAAASALADH